MSARPEAVKEAEAYLADLANGLSFMAAHVFTIAAGTAFAETLARGRHRTSGAKGGVHLRLPTATIFLPTRRATRTLNEAFARVLGGGAFFAPNSSAGRAWTTTNSRSTPTAKI